MQGNTKLCVACEVVYLAALSPLALALPSCLAERCVFTRRMMTGKGRRTETEGGERGRESDDPPPPCFLRPPLYLSLLGPLLDSRVLTKCATGARLGKDGPCCTSGLILIQWSQLRSLTRPRKQKCCLIREHETMMVSLKG